jgi:hypothetical protein
VAAYIAKNFKLRSKNSIPSAACEKSLPQRAECDSDGLNWHKKTNLKNFALTIFKY